MADKAFKVGDQVQLKSGGPVMTVKTEANQGHQYCQWFAGKKLEQGSFPVDSLQVAPKDAA
jgi:uncharacterized protein YodC (DUF2158 family)